MYDELVKRLRTYAILVVFPLCDDITEAADAIEDLSKRVDESIPKDDAEIIIAEVAKPRWIPVTERLPLYGQDVLAVRTYGDGEKCQEVLTAHIAVWNEETGEKWWNVTNITHWMPLPEPPKEET